MFRILCVLVLSYFMWSQCDLYNKVALLGTNSIFGRMTSFLLKQSPVLNTLTLYDDKNISISNDIQYMNTGCKIKFVNGIENMGDAIKTADIIIIGDDCVKGMTHETAFSLRAPVISNYVQQIACYNSNAIIIVATTPVNMTVPLVTETLKNMGKWNEKKILGMTNVENMRARCILANYLRINPRKINFPVIGGSSSETRVPLLSKMYPFINLNKPNLQKITCAVKTYGTKLHSAYGSQESLNRAHATSSLVHSVIAALNGQHVIETVLSYQNEINGTNYFSLPVILGEAGIKEYITFSNISQIEKYLLSYAVPCMAADAMKAKHYSDKMKENLIKMFPQTKLNNLSWNKEENIKVKMMKVQNIPNQNRINGTSQSVNLENSLKSHSSEKEKVSTLDTTDVNNYSKQCENNNVISGNITDKQISPQDKVPMCMDDENIALEIDETLRVNNSLSKSKSMDKVKFEEITLNNSVDNITNSEGTLSIPTSVSITIGYTGSHSGHKDAINHLHANKNKTSKFVCSKDNNSTDNISTNPENKIKDFGCSLSMVSPVNKLTESPPTKNIYEAANYTFSSGLENCKSLKRYHKKVSSLLDDFGKKLCNHNKKNADDTLLFLSKEKVNLFPLISPDSYKLTASGFNTSYPIKNAVQLKISNKCDNVSKFSTGGINDIGDLSTPKFLTSKNDKQSLLPLEEIQNFCFNCSKNLPVLEHTHKKLSEKPTIFNNIQESLDDNSQQEMSLKLDRLGIEPKKDLPKSLTDEIAKKNSRCLECFQTTSVVKAATGITVSYNKESLNLHSNALSDFNTSSNKYSLQINKPHLIRYGELFKSSKPLVTEWPRFVSSESHDKQIDNSKFNNNDLNYQQKQVSLLSQKYVNSHQESAVPSPQINILKHQVKNSHRGRSPQIPVSSPKLGKRFNIYQESTKKADKDLFFESVLCKQKDVFLSGLKYSSFNYQESDYSSFPGKELNHNSKCFGKNKESKRNNHLELKKFHLLKSKSVVPEKTKVVSSLGYKSEPSSAIKKRKNTFLETESNNSIKMPSTPVKTVCEESLQTTSKLDEEKGINLIETKIKETVENRFPTIPNHTTSKDVNDDTLIPSNDKHINKPSMNIQQNALAVVQERKSEVELSNLYDSYSCKLLTNGTCDDPNQQPYISLEYPVQVSYNNTINSGSNVENYVEEKESSLSSHDIVVQRRANDSVEN